MATSMMLSLSYKVGFGFSQADTMCWLHEIGETFQGVMIGNDGYLKEIMRIKCN